MIKNGTITFKEACKTDVDLRFLIKDESCNHQYAGIYFCRLSLLRQHAELAIKLKWPGVPLAQGLKDLKQGDEQCAIGTLYKSMILKPSALDTYMKSLDLEDTRTKFSQDSDSLCLEDNAARVQLTAIDLSRFPVDTFATGMILGVKGKLRSGARFEVDDFTFPALPPLEIEPSFQKFEGPSVAFVSGLAFGIASYEALRLRLRDFLTSELARPFDIRALVLAGNTFMGVSTSGNMGGVAAADAWIGSVAASMAIHLMPGHEDPIGVSLPQQPLPSCYIQQCNRYGSVLRATNPHTFTCDDVRFTGSSGQCIQDILNYSSITSSLDALELTIKCRCLAPTAPDTLACFPFGSNDPFSMAADETFPHVVFSATTGEEHGFVRMDNGTLGLLIPCFHRKPMVYLVSLKNLTVHQVTFKCSD